MSHQSSSLSLLEGEKIINEPNAHWSWILPTLFKAMFASIFFAGLVYVVPSYFLKTANGKIIIFIFLLGIIGYILIVRKKHHLSRFIITNYRLINIDRQKFFHNEVCEIQFDHIQSVRILISGFFGTIFRYGVLIISTADEESQFEIHHLAHPREVQSIILTVRDEFLRNLGVYNNSTMDQIEMKDNQLSVNNQFANFFKAIQMIQTPLVSESKSVVGFEANNKKKDIRRVTTNSNSSYLVGMLSDSGGFKKSVIQSLSKELNNGGRPHGHRLVKTVTSLPHFNKKVIDDLGRELLN